MQRSTLPTAFFLAVCLVLLLTSYGFTDVSPGDVLDKTSWEKARGLVPEELVDWIKRGEFVLRVAELKYSPAECFPPFAREAAAGSTGKYALGEDDWIVEKASGRRAKGIVGLPFLEIDPQDPKAATKVMYDNKYVQYIAGDVRSTFYTPFLDRSGYIREQKAKFLNMVMDGNPRSAERSNPDGIVKYQIMLVASPYDIAGTAVMTWSYLDPTKEDNTFGYIPAIRRVRRMSPGNRSDALFGSDFAIDDASCYDGKVTAMEWKLLRKQEALVPYSDSVPERIVRNEEGEWETTEGVKDMVYGYQKEGWQGAPWAPVNWVWVKQTAYVIEMEAKDRYYNYGAQQIWVDADAFVPAYKVIHDKAGRYWKMIVQAHAGFESSDGQMRLTYAGDQMAVDERYEHATLIRTVTPTDIWTYFAQLNEDDFSLAGFQKFCK